MHRFTSRDLMVTVLPDGSDRGIACAGCTNEPSGTNERVDRVADADLGILQEQLDHELA